jgi:MOSC domain-containing protein YiiM
MGGRKGTVEAIFLAAAPGGPPREVPEAAGIPGRGLEGDRHFDDPDAGDITLIEKEAIDRFRTEHGVDLSPGGSRRQVLVRGVDLADFVGRRFRVGEIECESEERCEPCNHLAGLVGTQAVLKGLLHTGLRAAIVKGGTIRAGDFIELMA